VLAAATGDIATDAWAAGLMNDSTASVCQAVGLTVGFEASSSIFFLLTGRGLLDISLFMKILTSINLIGFGAFVVSMQKKGKVQTEDEQTVGGLWEVLQQAYNLVRGAVNIRWWFAFSFLSPILVGHTSLLAVRYQAQGFSAELFAEYDLLLLPLSFLVMWGAGKVAQTPRLLSCLCWTLSCRAAIEIATLMHFVYSRNLGEAAVNIIGMRGSFLVLSQLGKIVDTITFVLRVTFFNRVAQQQKDIAGTVITLLTSISNLGGMLPRTLVPLVVNTLGTVVASGLCIGLGGSVLLLFWPKLRIIQDLEDPGWQIQNKKDQ